jgi:hypothetical protein
VVFAPGIISRNSLEHSPAIFSSKGNEVFWCSIELPIGKSNQQKIWYMKRINNRWTKAKTISPFGDSVSYSSLFLSIDNNKLYFVHDGTEKKEKDGITPKNWTRYYNFDIWYIERQRQGWSKPASISPVINNDNQQASPSLNNNGTLYFCTYLKGVHQECGIFRSKFQNGGFETPKPLPASINSITAQDWTPYIASDDSYLIFSSYRDGGYGQGDLYISFHDIEKDTWSEPVNMGELINTWAQERLPSVSPDGKYLFFTRWTKENHHDIFWVSTKAIDKLKEKYDIKK